MAEQSSRASEISLGEDLGDVAMKVNGVRVEVHTDGSILAYTNGPVKVSPIANDDGEAVATPAPKPGDRMPDGAVIAGICRPEDFFHPAAPPGAC
jgi:hypothetical protein